MSDIEQLRKELKEQKSLNYQRVVELVDDALGAENLRLREKIEDASRIIDSVLSYPFEKFYAKTQREMLVELSESLKDSLRCKTTNNKKKR